MTTIETAPGRHWRALRILGWGAAGTILLAPLVAMQVSDEVAWTATDFAVMGAMLVVAGLACEAAVRLLKTDGARFAACGAVGVAFLLIWVELAVGIFH
ncbi:MAG: hypothetical protein KF910_00160 [Brevundimonas sp.]|uniref:hypothetical protein n=1 Tax=Brevundimonas sp. TaxID=1871086 RepID=UPI0025C6CCC4|nr:hypothetical protein [Brevundimonas sp.]MBX3476000.1 hypothetical protein [Brevundimonas sp.]